MGIEKLSDFVYSKTKRNKSLNKGGPTIMKKKKLISLLLVASMAFSLAACGSSGGDDKDADKGGDEKTLKVAAVETAYGADMWKEVCSAFEKSHEGVKVELTIDKKLEDVINPQMKSGEYPDVILRAVGAESGITETFVKDNNLVDLTDVLDMTVEESLEYFANIPRIKNKIQTLYDVGLGYIKLGQPSTTLSGGEAQRVKLATELSKKATGKTLYILDEPTTGLHIADVHRLVDILQRLVDTGNTIIVIEHNLDLIKTADYIIDLGPEGGDAGGEIIAVGTPEQICKNDRSYTGKFLKKYLEK